MEQWQLFQNYFPIVIEQPVLWGQDKNIHKAEHYKALVDSQTGNVFSVIFHFLSNGIPALFSASVDLSKSMLLL